MAYIFGLTGPIASGKSKTSAYFSQCGAHVFDADKAVHKLQKAGESCTLALVKKFGPQVLAEDQSVNRQFLSQMVLQDPNIMTEIEAIIFPAVYTQARQFIQSLPPNAVGVLDAPLLFESEINTLCNSIAWCYCPPSVRQSRALQRLNMTLEKYQFMINRQKTDDAFQTLCHHPISTQTEAQMQADVTALLRLKTTLLEGPER